MLGNWYVFGYEGFPEEDRRRFYSQRDDPCDSDEERGNNLWVSCDSRCVADRAPNEPVDSEDDDEEGEDDVEQQRIEFGTSNGVKRKRARDNDLDQIQGRAASKRGRRRRPRRGPPVSERVVNMGLLSETIVPLFGHSIARLTFDFSSSPIEGHHHGDGHARNEMREYVVLVGGADLVLRRPTSTIALFEKHSVHNLAEGADRLSVGWRRQVIEEHDHIQKATRTFTPRYAHCVGTIPGSRSDRVTLIDGSEACHVLVIGGVGSTSGTASAPLVGASTEFVLPIGSLFLTEPVLLTFHMNRKKRRAHDDDERCVLDQSEAGTILRLPSCRNLDCINAPSPRAYASLCPWTKFISVGGEIVTHTNRFAYFGGTNDGRRPLTVQEGGGLQLLVVDVMERVLECTTIPTCGLAPTTRFGHSATCANDSMYVYGGIDTSGQTQNSLHVLDYTTCVWREAYIPSAASVPSRAFHTALWSPWSRSIVFAGGESHRGVVVPTTWEYCTISDRWQQVSFPLLARSSRDGEAEYDATHTRSASRESSSGRVGPTTRAGWTSGRNDDDVDLDDSTSASVASPMSHAPSSSLSSSLHHHQTFAFNGKETVYALHQRLLPPCQQQRGLRAEGDDVDLLLSTEQLHYSSLIHGSQAAGVTCSDGMYITGGTCAPLVMTLSRVGPAADSGSLKYFAAMYAQKFHALLPSSCAPCVMMDDNDPASSAAEAEMLHDASVMAKQQQAREWLQQCRHAAEFRRHNNL